MRRIKKLAIWVGPVLAVIAAGVFTYANRQWFMQDERNGTVSARGSMLMKRAAHTATQLRSGEVLIAGGMERAEGDEINTATAELYDYRSGSFSGTGAMTVARAGHTATLLPAGNVLITGGFNDGQALQSAELYQTQTRTFSATPAMKVPRDRHSATLLLDGTVLIAGGNMNEGVSAIAVAEIYDPSNGRFEIVGPMKSPRSAHAATLLRDGTVLLTGGSRQRFDYVLNTAEIYDPNNRSFHPAGNMNAPRHKQGATLLADGRVLISGGSVDAREMGGRVATSEVFDPKQKKFTLTGGMTAARFKMTSAVVPVANGDVLVAGDGEYAETYRSSTQTYGTARGRIDDSWMYACAVALPDESVLITGGYNSSMQITSGAWIYRPASGVVTAKSRNAFDSILSLLTR